MRWDNGLGKTVQALSVLNCYGHSQSLIICPSSLKINWKIEAERWLTVPQVIGIAEGKKWPEGDLIILNYDIIGKHMERMLKTRWQFVIWDECQYLKSAGAKRTKLAKKITAERMIFLTGTPLLNKPIEIYNVLSMISKDYWGSRYEFASTYCDIKQVYGHIDMSGASNLPELQQRLRSTCMIRRLKKDVLKDLPAKARQIIELPAASCSALLARQWADWRAVEPTVLALRQAVRDSKLTGDETSHRQAVEALRQGQSAAFTAMAAARKAVAEAKLPMCLAHLDDILEEVDKVVVFFHHRFVGVNTVEHLKKAGISCGLIHGEVAQQERQRVIEEFQKGEMRVFVGSILAAGVGITLTAASHEVFFESSWVPAEMDQCESRCHRIGLKESLLIQHLVLSGSLDATMMKRVVSKQRVLDAALDNQKGAP